jgi:hypothetical protein
VLVENGEVLYYSCNNKKEKQAHISRVASPTKKKKNDKNNCLKNIE